MSSRQKIKEFQKTFYDQLILRAKELEAPSKELEEYRKNQQHYITRSFKEASIDKLIDRASHSQIIYLGDFHTFDQNTKNLQRLLKEMNNNGEPIIMAFEFIHHKKQKYIDYYLNGHLTELEFLEEINFRESWRFPWHHYKPFFELAKKDGHKIIGLNHNGSLYQRDCLAAKVITENYIDYPHVKMIVLFGELHITPNKLPALVEKEIPNIEQLIIHQNLDYPYWSKEGKVAEVIEFGPNEFSIQSSPPWIKYESMIYWYENLIEDPEFDLHEIELEKGLKLFNSNVMGNFLNLCEKLNHSLGLHLKKEDITVFELLDYNGLEQIQNDVLGLQTEKEIDFYNHLLQSSTAFKLPHKNKYFCPSYSLNRMASLVGVHLRTITTGYSQLSLNSKYDFFLEVLFQSALSFFCSKTINHYRKCNHYADIKRLIEQATASKKKEFTISLNILDALSSRDTLEKTIRSHTYKSLYRPIRHVGKIIGELAFNSYIKEENEEEANLIKNLLFSETGPEVLETLLEHISYNQIYTEASKRVF
ncbi:MAG: ChaN family lipoprotein [Bacteriovoracaceae bacterium]